MKKMFLIFVFVLSVFTFGFKVDAETTDTIGPVIEKIELDKEEVSPGDILRITLTVTDESEIDTVRIIYNKGYNGTDDLGKSFYATKQDDGTYVGEIEITDKFYSDYYRISTGADDIHGNSASITQDIVFKVVGAIEDAKGPVIEKIDLDKEEVSPGDILKVTLTVTDESEIDTVRIIYNKGYNGTDDIGKSFYATKQDDGTYVGEIEITDKFYSDYYRITTSARDIYGNNASQTQDAVFKVVGAIEDVVGPAIEKIELDKEIVSAGDTLKIILTVTDDSEIDNVRIVYVKGEYINSSGSKSFYATKQEDGTYVGKIEITDAFEIGKYKISTTARDIYGNKESLVQETNFYVEEKNNDVTGPEIEKMELSSNEVNIGDTLRVTVTAIDESEIDQVVIYYVGNNIEETIYATKQADGTYVAEIEITEKFQREYYTITAYGYDIHGYSSEITKDDQFYVKDGIKDIVGPVIEKIEVDKEVVSPGDIIRVTLTVTDDSEIDYVYIYCAREKNSNGNGISKRIEKQEDGTYVGEIEITEEFYSDGYRISTGAYDIHGNSASISRDGTFSVVGGIEDITAPKIEKIEITPAEVSPGDIVTIKITVTDESDIDKVYFYYYKGLYEGGTSKAYETIKQEDGTYVGQIEITDKFFSDYYRVSVTAYDAYGNSKYSDQSSIFLVTGGIDDLIKPEIDELQVDKEIVRPGDIVTIKVKATDESGIGKVEISYTNPLRRGTPIKNVREENGYYIAELEITEEFYSGYYSISVTAYDIYENRYGIAMDNMFKIIDGLNDITSIILSENEITLNKGESNRLEYTINPNDTTQDKTLTWKSSDESVVTVENGLIKAVGRGTATITVTTTNGKKATAKVTVKEPKVLSVTVEKTEYNLTIDSEDITINPTIETQDNPTYEIEWTSSNENVVTIEEGVLKVIGTGAATITLKAQDKIATIEVNVTSPLKEIQLNKTEITLNKDETTNLEVTFNPIDTTDDKTLTWTSSDETVVTVENGLIKAVGRGTATITVTTTNGKKATAKVTVKEPKVLSVTVEKTEYNLTIDSEDITINPTIETQDNPTYEIEWTSSNENVVTIEEGVLKVIGTGAATITLKAQDKLATIEVNVTSPLKEITINESINEMLIGETIQLTIQYNPVNTTDNKKIIWTSSDESIAIVENGLVTALEKGTVTITAMSLYGMTSSITITINSLYDGEYTSQKYNLDNPFIYTHTENFNLDDINVTGDYTKEYKDNILYIKAKGQVVAEYYVITIASDEYEITDNEIKYKGEFDLSKINFLINESVKITTYDELPQQKGFYLILELNENILEISHWVYVNDEEGGGSSLKQLSLRKIKEITDIIMTNSIDEMLFGEQYQLTAKINPADTDEEKILTWTSSDEKVITVENGLIKAVGRGTATITVTTVNGKTATAIVTVKEPKVLSVTVEKTEYNLTIDSEDITINPIIETQDNPTYEIEWTSSNENVVTIEKGLLKVIGPGAAIITITAGNESVTIQVFVEQKDIANLNYSEVESQIYNGTEIKPTIIITDGEYQLKENIDYTIEYNNNLNAGTAEITITGINNYKGNNKINFVIEKAKLEINYISENTEYTYDGLLHGINLNIISPNNVVIKYADEYGEYTLDTMPMYKEIGEYKILYKLMIDSNYEFITGENTLIIKKATIDVTSKDYIGIEDEEEHTIDLKVNNTEEYDIYYSVDSTDYNLNEMPKFKLPGVYEIFFKIISNNFEEYTSSNIIKIFGITEYAESLKLKNDILIIKDYDNSILNLYNKIKFYASTYKWKHFDNNKEIVDRETLKTGDYVQLILNDEKIYEYNISILGDVDGDGEIAPLDYVKIKNHIMATNLIKEGVSLIAADANGDEIVSPLDYVRVKNYIMNGGK